MDDLIATRNVETKIEQFKCMKSEFEMTDLGSLNYFVGQ